MQSQHAVRRLWRSVIAIGPLAMSFCLTPLQAQQQPPPDQPELASEDVSDEDLEKFVTVYEELEVIRTELHKRIAQIQDVEAVQQLQQQATARMVEIVQEQNMEASEYNALARAVNNDQELFERFQAVKNEQEKDDAQEPKD